MICTGVWIYVVGKRVSLDVGEGAGDDLPRVGGAVGLEIGGFDPVLEHPTELEWKCRSSASDDQAP
jgi:hypothetical protein